MQNEKFQEFINNDPDIKDKLKYINSTPELQSILYDIDLLPEQTLSNVHAFFKTIAFVTLYQRIIKLEEALSGCRVFVAQCTLEENCGSEGQRQHAIEQLESIDTILDNM